MRASNLNGRSGGIGITEILKTRIPNLDLVQIVDANVYFRQLGFLKTAAKAKTSSIAGNSESTDGGEDDLIQM